MKNGKAKTEFSKTLRQRTFTDEIKQKTDKKKMSVHTCDLIGK